MPPTPTWYTRIPRVIEILRQDKPKQIVRTDLEQLLAVGPRRAQQLMRTLPTYTVGSVVFADPDAVLTWLEELQAGHAVGVEFQRRERLEGKLAVYQDEHKSRCRVIYEAQAAPPAVPNGLKDLPATTILRPGELHIRFEDTADLLRQLFQLAQGISADFLNIERILNP